MNADRFGKRYSITVCMDGHELLPTNPVEADRCLSHVITWLEDT